MLVSLLLLSMAVPTTMFGGVRRALTVFIGDYPPQSGWRGTAAVKDRGEVLDMLHSLGFQSEDILCLNGGEATLGAIVGGLESLCRSAVKGDEIYIHFSCHGQQITDVDGDEALIDPKDRYDEALVPYDAFISYGWNGYMGQNHLTDDTINKYLSRLTDSVGPSGCVLLVVDACHSGDVQRNEEGDSLPYRGTFDAFELPYRLQKTRSRPAKVNWITISACKSFQTNFEVEVEGERHGRLSYAMTRCLEGGMNVEDLIRSLEAMYRTLPMPPSRHQSISWEVPRDCKNKKLFP